MNKTITFLSIAAVAVVAGGLLTLTLTNANETLPFNMMNSKGAAFGGKGMHGFWEKFAEVKTAIQANDFAAFQTAVTDTPFADKITTEAQFAQLVEMHTLMQAGQKEEAKAIAESLGLPTMMKGMRAEKGVQNEAIKAAITANDYTAFQTAQAELPNSPLASIDTAEEFAKLVKMHSLLDEAKAIAEELDLPMMQAGGHRGPGMMKGFMRKLDNGDNEPAFDDDDVNDDKEDDK